MKANILTDIGAIVTLIGSHENGKLAYRTVRFFLSIAQRLGSLTVEKLRFVRKMFDLVCYEADFNKLNISDVRNLLAPGYWPPVEHIQHMSLLDPRSFLEEMRLTKKTVAAYEVRVPFLRFLTEQGLRLATPAEIEAGLENQAGDTNIRQVLEPRYFEPGAEELSQTMENLLYVKDREPLLVATMPSSLPEFHRKIK